MMLTRGEQRCLEFITRCDFTGKGTAITQAELACHLGYKRPYVNALVKSLRTKGRINVEKRRHPGSPFDHNVYRVPDWNPHVRRGICEIRRAFKASRTRSTFPCSDTKRTATAPRAQTTPRAPFPRCNTAALVAREAPTWRTRMCEDCGRLLEENKQLLEHLREGTSPELQEQMAKYAELDQERCGLILTVRKLSSECAALRSAANPPEESQTFKDIRFVITRWKRLCGHPRAKCPVDGKAWKAVKRALGPWEYPLLEVLEAVEGAALAPYDAGYGRRKVSGTAKERKDDLGYILRDEENIAKFRDIALRARNATLEQLYDAQTAASATDQLYARYILDALAKADTLSLQLARAWHYDVGDEMDALAHENMNGNGVAA